MNLAAFVQYITDNGYSIGWHRGRWTLASVLYVHKIGKQYVVRNTPY